MEPTRMLSLSERRIKVQKNREKSRWLRRQFIFYLGRALRYYSKRKFPEISQMAFHSGSDGELIIIAKQTLTMKSTPPLISISAEQGGTRSWHKSNIHNWMSKRKTTVVRRHGSFSLSREDRLKEKDGEQQRDRRELELKVAQKKVVRG